MPRIALQPKHIITNRRRVKVQTAAIKEASCTGGFCELPYKPASTHKQFLSAGEGIPPPLKIKETKVVYKLSYPHDEIIEPETISPMYLSWMGRRWYACP